MAPGQEKWPGSSTPTLQCTPVRLTQQVALPANLFPRVESGGAQKYHDANTGKQIWKTYMADAPKPWKKNTNGVQLYGPATGGIWDAPTIDPVPASRPSPTAPEASRPDSGPTMVAPGRTHRSMRRSIR